MESENNMLLIVIVTLLLLIFLFSNNRNSKPWGQKWGKKWKGWRRNCPKRARNIENLENLENVRAVNATLPRSAGSVSHNPRMYQQAISEQVIDDNFIPLPQNADYPWAKNGGVHPYGETDILDDGSMGNMGLNFNMCSKSCCSTNSVWPAPHSMTPDDFVLMSDKEFVPSSYSCSNSYQDAGCICLTKDQSRFMRSRGNNSDLSGNI
jgi:hypothetical protein